MIYNGWISYWITDEEITDVKFNEVTIDVFEKVYGEIDGSKIISVRLDLA